jgi:hypothetical protein
MIDERVTPLRAELPSSDPATTARFTAFIERGEDIEAELLLVAHGECGAYEVDRREMKDWIKRASWLLGLARAHRDELRRWGETRKGRASGWPITDSPGGGPRRTRRPGSGPIMAPSGMTAEEFVEESVAWGVRELLEWAEERGMTTGEAIAAIEQMPPGERPRFGVLQPGAP